MLCHYIFPKRVFKVGPYCISMSWFTGFNVNQHNLFCTGFVYFTVQPVLNGHSKIDKTNVLMTNGSLMKVESVAE